MIHDDVTASLRTRIRCALLAALCAIAAFVVAGCAGASPEPAPPAAEADNVPADGEFMRDSP